ncbi:hypothetical protein AB0J82_36505 [Asanoa sp. NPDC049518]|uniref:hypothetical protein n=1 Tax=unclassified Asanoa TaxID=2685164 RepID=UPI0034375010
MTEERVREPNHDLARARHAEVSPTRPRRRLSRQEVADACNAVLAELYRAEGRRQLHAGVTAGYVGALERGEIRWPNDDYRYALRAVFDASDTELGFYIDRPDRPAGHHTPVSLSSAGLWLDPLRQALLVRQLDPLEPLTEARIVSAVNAAHNAYQSARYRDALKHLPTLIHGAEKHAYAAPQRQRLRAYQALAGAYLVASKLAAKGGDGTLAWLAADRAANAAAQLDRSSHALQALTSYQAACALARIPGRTDDAQAVVMNALDTLASRHADGSTTARSVQGALLLQGSMIAAQSGQEQASGKLLAAATTLASALPGDQNELWTAFGPTNVEIHRVAIAVTLHQPSFAIRAGEQLNTDRLPAVLVSRRAQVHIDLAVAYTQVGGGPSAVLHLLEAERIAPQALTHNADAQAAIRMLLRREKQARTPGLRSLAERATAAD